MQIDFFSVGCNTPYKTTKPIRLIELFAGIGSQAKALERIQANFEHYRICEFDKYAVQSYNAIHGTDFKPTDITKITADDLGITDTDKYEYIMTYSFPCTDLSVAGKQAGMAKGSGTRSGLLWEVERLLTECKELPQVLLMENVPQVLNGDFGGWLSFLEALGYRNYYKCLNAKSYGIPQNRDRCFMVSVLGDYYYDFPKPVPLQLRLKDMLESKVDEKYYLSEKSIEKIKLSNFAQEKARIQTESICGTILARDYKDPKCVVDKDVSNAVRSGGRGSTDKHCWDLVKEPTIIQQPHGYNKGQETEHCPSITTSSWESNNFLKEPTIKEVGKIKPHRHSSTSNSILDATGLCPTIDTMSGGGREPKVLEPQLVGGVGDINFGKQYRQGNRIYDSQAIACALNASPVGNAGGESYLYKVEPIILDDIYNNRDAREYSDAAPTLRSERQGLKVVEPSYIGVGVHPVSKKLEFDGYHDTNCPTLLATDYKAPKTIQYSNYRIRKLTPLECYRLMGFDDADFYKAKAAGVSDSQLYKQAGNSIVVNVLEAIFKQLF